MRSMRFLPLQVKGIQNSYGLHYNPNSMQFAFLMKLLTDLAENKNKGHSQNRSVLKIASNKNICFDNANFALK